MACFQNQYNAPAGQSDYDEDGNLVIRTVDSVVPLTGHALGAHHEGAGRVLRRSRSSNSSSMMGKAGGGKRGLRKTSRRRYPESGTGMMIGSRLRTELQPDMA